jgi:hypothetical protein
MNYYLIWRSPNHQANIDAFNAINNLRSLSLTPVLIQWAVTWGLDYPNDRGTQRYADLNQCQNPDSACYGATAIALSEALYTSITPEIIQALHAAGVPLPDEGLEFPVSELPEDWVAKSDFSV